MSVRRVKVRDFVHSHEYASGGLVFRKAVRVRTYEAEGKVPLIVLSVSDDPTQNVTQDVERVAAEVLLREYPEETVRAKRSKPWFLLVEHLPRVTICLDHGRPAGRSSSTWSSTTTASPSTGPSA